MVEEKNNGVGGVVEQDNVAADLPEAEMSDAVKALLAKIEAERDIDIEAIDPDTQAETPTRSQQD